MKLFKQKTTNEEAKMKTMYFKSIKARTIEG